jgi:hypothetical protein
LEGNTESSVTDFSGAQILGAAALCSMVRFGVPEGIVGNGTEERVVVRRIRLPGRETL